MTTTVAIGQWAAAVQVEPGQTVLEAALQAGVPYPFGCQSGNCGACKSRLLAGRVDLAPYSEFALTREERSAGLILACRALPAGDCAIAWLETADIAAHPLRDLACRVAAIRPATHDITILTVAILAGGPFTFSAGQSARVTVPGCLPRDYSMANAPGADALEFHVRAIPGGAVSPVVRARLAVGDWLRVQGPHGISFLREAHRGPILALAGGSGLAPIKAIVERALAIGMCQPIHLYFGVRDERDLYGEAELRALTARHPNLVVTPVLSEPSGPTARRTGLLAAALSADCTALQGAKAYLAGPPVMVDTCVVRLRALGVAPQDCHADAFYTEADKARLGWSP